MNGQELGEPGAGREGYGGDDGRTTIFDYWCMPEFAKWVNGHAYDGAGLSSSQKDLRRYYAALLALCQDSSVRGSGYWGLKYFNRNARFKDCPNDLYTFARYQDGSKRLLLVAANFRPKSTVDGRVRIPQELAALVDLRAELSVRILLDRSGLRNVPMADLSRQSLLDDGFVVSIPNQTSHVYTIE